MMRPTSVPTSLGGAPIVYRAHYDNLIRHLPIKTGAHSLRIAPSVHEQDHRSRYRAIPHHDLQIGGTHRSSTRTAATSSMSPRARAINPLTTVATDIQLVSRPAIRTRSESEVMPASYRTDNNAPTRRLSTCHAIERFVSEDAYINKGIGNTDTVALRRQARSARRAACVRCRRDEQGERPWPATPCRSQRSETHRRASALRRRCATPSSPTTFENFFHPFVGELDREAQQGVAAGLLDPRFPPEA